MLSPSPGQQLLTSQYRLYVMDWQMSMLSSYRKIWTPIGVIVA